MTELSRTEHMRGGAEEPARQGRAAEASARQSGDTSAGARFAAGEPTQAYAPVGRGPAPSTSGRPVGAPAGRAARPTGPGVAPPASGPRGPRRARLNVRRVDPWSVLKFSFVLSIALLIVWIVAVAALYTVLDAMGVFDAINHTLGQLTSSSSSAGVTVVFAASRVIGWAAVIGGINALLFTALATLGAFLYNLCSTIAGGIELTLTEGD